MVPKAIWVIIWSSSARIFFLRPPRPFSGLHATTSGNQNRSFRPMVQHEVGFFAYLGSSPRTFGIFLAIEMMVRLAAQADSPNTLLCR